VPVATRGSRLGIGEVIRQLKPDFPEISISKVRFLESEGLVEPERTSSGYRKFSVADVERLRYILTAQRDQYLPLKVIREHLDAMDRGLQPPTAAGESPKAPPLAHVDGLLPPTEASTRHSKLRMSRSELLASSGLTEEALAQLESFGLVSTKPGVDHYDADALVVASTVGEMAAYGLEPRHLRPFKSAADRQVGLIEQVVTPMARRRGTDAKERADAAAEQLAALSVRLHAALLKAGVQRAH
jgi:DNA-binding transcriptional MerR regulator